MTLPVLINLHEINGRLDPSLCLNNNNLFIDQSVSILCANKSNPIINHIKTNAKLIFLDNKIVQ